MESVFQYRHVIWDWNGTLFDDLRLCVDVMNTLLQARGMPPVTVERYQEIFDFPVKEYYRRLGFDFSRDPFEVVGTEFIESYEARRLEAGLHRQAKTVVRLLHESGVGQSVLSAYLQDTLDELVSHFGLATYFRKCVGLQDHYAESKLENGLQWIEELGHHPCEVLFVGDSLHDYEVARNMEVDCILISSGHHSRARLEACPVSVLDRLEDLPGVQESLAARSG